MKKIFLLVFIIIGAGVYASTPHPVNIEIGYNGGGAPDSLLFSAWRTANPSEVLDNSTPDCYYPNQSTDFLQIQCGAFSSWVAGDILHVEVYDPITSQGGEGDYTLTWDNFQIFQIEDGGIILEYIPPLVFELPEAFNTFEDQFLNVNFNQYASSYLQDELTLTFSGNTNIIIEIEGVDVTFSAPENWSGQETISFTIADEHSNTLDDDVSVNFQAVNDPPEFSIPVPAFSLDEDSSLWIDFSAYYSDVDNEELELTCTGNNHIDIQITGGEVTLIPEPDWNGAEVITFIVSDGVSRETAQDTVEVIVNPLNDAPFMDLPETISFLEGSVYVFDCSDLIWDVDGDELDISITGNEEINPLLDELVITFEVPNGWHGSETMVFSANDNQTRAVTSDTVNVSILAMSDTELSLPQLNIDDGDEITIDLNTSMLFEEWSIVSFSLNIEYNPYVLSWEGFSQENSIINNGNVLCQEELPGNIEISYFYYQPVVGDGIIIELYFDTVCFGESALDIQDAVFNDTAIENISDGYITVNDIGLEHPPVAIAGADLVADELTEVIVDGSASFDPDGDAITYLWDGPPEIVFADPALAVTSFMAPDVDDDTEFIINLICSDGTYESDPDMAVITVFYVNHAPEIELPESLSFPEDSVYTADFSEYISDIDPDDLTLSSSGNQDISIEIDGFDVIFSAPENWNGSEVLNFTINDNVERLTDTDEIEIIVNAVNDAPVADAGMDQEVHDGSQVTLDASNSTDIEGDVLTYIWIAPQGIMLDDPYSITPSFMAPQVLDPTEYVFMLQINDEQTRETDSDEVIITVIDDEPAILQVELLPENQALFTWMAPGSGGSGEELEQGFEGPVVPQGWINIDNDADGYGWFINSESPHSGTNCIASASYFNNNILTPDNWLITPSLELGGLSSLMFWISSEDEFYPHEHYSIRISTSGTDPSDFTDILLEETLEDNQWEQHSISLMNWAGQACHIAFVHHDCTNQSLLKLDDVQIINVAERELQGYNVYLDNEFQDFVDDREYIFEDVIGEHTAAVEAVYDEGVSEQVSITFDHTPQTDSEIIPQTTKITSIYPNPFNPETTICFELSSNGFVNLEVFNIKGQNIETLICDDMLPGRYSFTWNASNKVSGIYFLRFKTNNMMQFQKIVLMK